MAPLSIILPLILAVACVGFVEASDHIVGGSTGWTIPRDPSFYQTWAENREFFVGDKLVFLFTTGIHNVQEVKAAEFEACRQSFQDRGHYSGPAIVRLSSPGNHFFICGVGKHCALGQKLNLTVAAAPALSSDNGSAVVSIHASTNGAAGPPPRLLGCLLSSLLFLSSSLGFLF